MKYLSATDVVMIHEQVIEPSELQGMTQNKFIETILSRIDKAAQGIIDESELSEWLRTIVIRTS